MDGHVRRLAKARSQQFVDLLRSEFAKLPAAEDGSVLGKHLLRGLRSSRGVSQALAAHGKAAAARQGGVRREPGAAASATEGDPFLAYPALLALLGEKRGGGVRVTWARVLRQIKSHQEPAAPGRGEVRASGEEPPVRDRGRDRDRGQEAETGAWDERRGSASERGSAAPAAALAASAVRPSVGVHRHVILWGTMEAEYDI